MSMVFSACCSNFCPERRLQRGNSRQNSDPALIELVSQVVHISHRALGYSAACQTAICDDDGTPPTVNISASTAPGLGVRVRTARLIFVFAKKPSVTTLFAIDQNENVLVKLHLVVTLDLAELREALKSVIP